MQILENEDLSKYTTFRMGGTAEKMYFPESAEELEALIREYPDILDYVIGGGSNLLINDEAKFERVLCTKKINSEIQSLGDGEFYAGASEHLQILINKVNAEGYGGIEYLFSVPGLVGGAVYMNAGRGPKYKLAISDYIISVDYVDETGLHTMMKEDMGLSYRHTVFQEMKAVITGVRFKFRPMKPEVSDQRKKGRIELCKKVQDMSSPNFGTVFSNSFRPVIELVKLLGMGKKKGVHFSKKTKNWLLNSGGDFKTAVMLIGKVEKMHRLVGKKCKAEVRIWK